MRAADVTPMTAAELVAAVEAAGLGEYGRDKAYNARRSSLLADLGFDQLDWLRACAGRPIHSPVLSADNDHLETR
jgi:hypothetical protein